MVTAAQSLRERFFELGAVPDCPVYDLHGHMGDLQGACLPKCSPEAMIDSMVRAGVRAVVFCHHDSLTVPDIGNRVTIEAVRRFPDRFRGYCGINPNHPDILARDVDGFDDFRDVFVGFKLLADYHVRKQVAQSVDEHPMQTAARELFGIAAAKN